MCVHTVGAVNAKENCFTIKHCEILQTLSMLQNDNGKSNFCKKGGAFKEHSSVVIVFTYTYRKKYYVLCCFSL